MALCKPKYVTLGWDGKPTLLLDDGMILPKAAELIIYRHYYTNSDDGWPRDPETGEKLPRALPILKRKYLVRNLPDAKNPGVLNNKNSKRKRCLRLFFINCWQQLNLMK